MADEPMRLARAGVRRMRSKAKGMPTVAPASVTVW